jgi:hypothetical protein
MFISDSDFSCLCRQAGFLWKIRPEIRNFPFMEYLFPELPKISIDSASQSIYLYSCSKLLRADQSRS